MLVEPTDSNPFNWSEIHSLAKAKLGDLDKIIRAEILACKESLPASGGARHQFFVLLAERADDWASRGRNVYMECLEVIGREQSERINRSIWENGLTFFIREKLREYMILVCGINKQELEWAEKGSPRVRGTPRVRAVILTLHEIDKVIQQIWVRFRYLMNGSGNWLADTQKLLETIKAAHPEDLKFAMGRAPTSVVRDFGPEQTPLRVSPERKVASTNGIPSETEDDAPWQQFSSDFSKLANEEKSLKVCHLGAMVVPESSRSSDLEDWKTHEGHSEHFRARFELLASQAGKALGPLPVGANPFYYWLHRLYQHLREMRSHLSQRFFISSTEGETREIPLIDSACEASSIFSLHLQKRILERDQQEKVLATCFQDWIENNFVNVSIPPRVSERNRVSIVAESARTSIPIHFLSSRLQKISLPRGSTEFGSPRKFFNQVADTYGLIWVITSYGLWMAQQPPSDGEYIDADGRQHNEVVGFMAPETEITPPAYVAPELHPADHKSTTKNAPDSNGLLL